MEGKENGAYTKYLANNDCEWFSKTAMPDVMLLHNCYNKQMFMYVATLVKKHWIDAGQHKLWNTFEESYITTEPFCNWYFSVSGFPGQYPYNNHNEAGNRTMKGNGSTEGDIRLKRLFEQ